MAGTHVEVECIAPSGSTRRTLRIEALIIAGWTGRDRAAMEAHIEELVALGVRRPAVTPTFYRAAAALVTTDEAIEVIGQDSSGEVEPVVVSGPEGLWVGVGSDHTDRKVETLGIALAKQLCPKPIAPMLWRLDDVAGHWDELVLRSHAVVDGMRRLYQEGPVSVMLDPRDLMRRCGGGAATLAPGTAMFCGTMAVQGEIAPAESFEIELEDPVLGRTIRHAYEIRTLPIVG